MRAALGLSRPVRWTRLTAAGTAALATLVAFAVLAYPSPNEPGSTAEGSGPPGPVGALDQEEDGTFRLALGGSDIAALVEEAMTGAPIEVHDLAVALEEAGPDAVGMRIEGKVDRLGLPARADLVLRRVDTRLEVTLSDVSVVGMALPDSVFGAVDEVVDKAADFGGMLSDAGIELTGMELEGDKVVLTGRAEDPEAIEEQLRAAARQRAEAHGAREAPEERLGRGRVTDADMRPESVYLALGDSITAGTSADDHRDAFTSRLHAQLEDRSGSDWGYLNLGKNGATAREVLGGTQLAMATDLMAQREVGLITVTVGSNELLALLKQPPCADDLAGPACATQVEETAAAFRDELDMILTALGDADPSAPIVVVGLYNPFSLGTGSDFEARADQAVSRLSAIAEEEAAKHGVTFAAVQSAFHQRANSTTLMSESPPDVHPSPLGHDVLAAAVLDAIDEWLRSAQAAEPADAALGGISPRP